MSGLPTGTVTFPFTDVEGSTARWEHQTEAMQAALARHDALLRAAIVEHGGHVVKTMGDAFHAASSRAPYALAAALHAQRQLVAESWDEIAPALGGLRVRMALHTGAAEERDGDYYGPPLNRAARLMSAGHGGQVLLSQTTYDLVRDAMRDGGRVLVVERAISPDYRKSLPVLHLDLEMLVNVGGIQRTDDEYRKLFGRAGLALTAVVPLHDPGQYAVFEGRPT